MYQLVVALFAKVAEQDDVRAITSQCHVAVETESSHFFIQIKDRFRGMQNGHLSSQQC